MDRPGQTCPEDPTPLPPEVRLHHLEALDRIGRTASRSRNLGDLFRGLMGDVRDIFQVDRAWLIHPCTPEAPSWRLIVNENLPDFGADGLLGADMPMDAGAEVVLQEALASREPVSYGPDRPHPWPEAEAQQIRSQLGIAVRPALGEPWLLGMHQCTYARIWTQAERRLFTDIADRVAPLLHLLLVQQELTRSQAKYRTITEQAADAILVTDDRGRLLEANARAEHLLQRPAADLLGRSIMDLYPPHWHDQALGLFRRVLEGDPLDSCPMPLVRPDGQELEVEISARATDIPEGRIVIGILRDCTERRQAQDALQASEARRAAVLHAIPDLMFLNAKDGTYLDCHAPRPDLLLAPPEAFLGHPIEEFLPPSMATAFRQRMDAALQDGHLQVFEYQLDVPTGRRFFEARIGRCDADDTVTIIRDITERRVAETRLREERDRLDATLESIGEAILVTDRLGRVMVMNGVAETLSGWPLLKALGQPYAEGIRLLRADSGLPLPDPVADVLQSGTPVQLDRGVAMETPEGERRSLALSARPLGDLEGVLLMLRDITDQERMEAELFKTQKLESLGVLAGGIAHDFNNILAGILGYLSLMEEEPGLDPAFQDMLSRCQKAAHQAKDLTRQLLTFARGGAPVKEYASLGQMVEDSVRFCLRGSPCRADLDLPMDLPPVEVDRNQISQVIQNIVINAIQAMPGGGTLRIAGRPQDPQAPLPPGLSPGSYVELRFQDEGCGMSAECISRIFDPFFTTKEKGNGLGLAIVYSILRKHGGHIGVASEVGKGTTFRILLPAATAPLPLSDRAPSAPTAFQGTGRVLVLDDEAEVLAMATSLLHRCGFTVDGVQDGREAVRAWKAAAAEGRPYLLGILDATIPGGMGGVDASREILAAMPEARLILSSGYASGGLGSDTPGFRGRLPKPYTYLELCALLHQVLGEA